MSGLLAHRVDGAGEPLLLLNGGMMSIAAWDEIVALLAPHHRVVRCDFRGQFLSPGQAPPDLAGHAADVVELLDALGMSSVHLVGTSFGALVGVVVSARFPDRVRSLVAATAFDHAAPEMTRLAGRLRDACREAASGGDGGRMFDVMLPVTYSDAFRHANAEMLQARRGRVAALPPSWFAGVDGLLAAVEDLDLRPFLRHVRCPTLVVVAGLDRTAFPERGRALAVGIPGARLVEVPDSGHALIVEQPARFAMLCLEFLGALPRLGPGAPPSAPGLRSSVPARSNLTEPESRPRKGASS